MLTYNRILLATDFSAPAGKAQAEAVKLARKHRAELHVLYVDVIAGRDAATFAHPALPDYVRNVEQVSLQAFPGATPIAYDRTVFKISRAESGSAGILHHAAEIEADLIVLGTHGRAALYEMVLGSVAQEVARLSPVSVLIVGAACNEAPACVLAPVDFSAGSRESLDDAARIAVRDGLPLVALHVVDFDRVAHPEELEIGERERKADEQLNQLVRDARLPIPAEMLVRIGPAGEEIVRTAAQRRAGVIVMAASRHTALERLILLGSVTKNVIRHAPCPVLISRQAPAKEASRAAA